MYELKPLGGQVQTVAPTVVVTKNLVVKPPSCEGCAYRPVGVGHCPDDLPAEPVIAALLEAPGEDEITMGRPLSGKAGKFAFWRLFSAAGMKREDVLICNTIRCRPFGNDGEATSGNKYPTGKLRQQAERGCRAFDMKIRAWAPDAFLITMHPAALLRSSASTRLVQAHIRTAVKLARRGRRPMILMGDKAMELVAPWLSDGGLKKWMGHWWLGKWGTKYDG